MPTKPTPLSLALADRAIEDRPTPLTAFKRARQWWLSGKRLNLSELAEELGVGRATLMRWVGNKELLLGEILWSLYKEIFEAARAEAEQRGLTGIDYLALIYNEINEVIVNAEPLQRFLRQDPQFGLQVLTSNVSRLQDRLVGAWKTLLEEEVAAGTIAPQMGTEDLAYFIIRIGEGVVYSDLICGRRPALEPAATAFRLLLSARSDEEPGR